MCILHVLYIFIHIVYYIVNYKHQSLLLHRPYTEIIHRNTYSYYAENYLSGYGHVTPLSQEGKLFCMLYALFGIPLTLVLLTALVDRLMIPTTKYLHFLNSRLGHLYPPFTIRLLHFGTILCTLIFLFLLLPAAMFTYLEPEWNYMDSLYYCFISLTTIGLGDYIPGDAPDQKYRPLYKLMITGNNIDKIRNLSL